MRRLALAFISLALLAACASPTAAPPVTQDFPTRPATSVSTAAGPTATHDPGAAPTATTVAATAANATAAATSAASATPATADTAAATAATAAAPTMVATSTANPAIAGGLIGLWQGNNNSFYLLNNDGTWNWDQDGQKVLTAPENQGRWWLEGDIFRIQDTGGKAPCPLAQVGSYQARLTGDVLTLTAVADLCAVRIDQTAGNYARQAAGP
jgi:hypothetical protein